MVSTVSFTDFTDSFTGNYKDSFSYDGKRALFDYLEELEDSTGEELELDPIAFACEYGEYADATECANNYFDFEGMTFGEQGEELETADQVEAKALAYLEDNTTVIPVGNTGRVIVAGF